MYCTSEQYELYSEIYFLGEKKLVLYTPNPEIILKSYLVDYRFHSNCKAEEVESCIKCAFLFHYVHYSRAQKEHQSFQFFQFNSWILSNIYKWSNIFHDSFSKYIKCTNKNILTGQCFDIICCKTWKRNAGNHYKTKAMKVCHSYCHQQSKIWELCLWCSVHLYTEKPGSPMPWLSKPAHTWVTQRLGVSLVLTWSVFTFFFLLSSFLSVFTSFVTNGLKIQWFVFILSEDKLSC